MTRYRSNGTLDRSFGSGGLVLTDFGDIDGIGDLAFQADGRLVAAGGTSVAMTAEDDIALARYHLHRTRGHHR